MTALARFRLTVVLVLCALAGAFAYVYLLNPPTQQAANAITIGGPFELASSNGGVVKSADLKGKPYGVFFGFTHCPEVCPTTMYEMSQSLKDLGDKAKDFRLFFITVDPERDTAIKLKDYLSNFDSRIEALVPTPAQLPQIAKSFRAIYEKVPTSDGGYSMNHTATLYLFGRDGEFRSTIAYGEERAMREKKIRSLLSEGS
jgi:protein SCO1/2